MKNNRISKYKEIKSKENNLEKQLANVKNELKDFINTITLEEANSYSYEELGIFINEFRYKDYELSTAIKQLYEDKKMDKYSILKTAYHYPELNNLIGKFSEDMIKEIDNILYYTGFNEYLMSDSNISWCQRIFNNRSERIGNKMKFKLTKEQWFELFDFLKVKGIVKYTYTLYDSENNLKSDSLTEEELEQYSKNIGDCNNEIYCELWLHGDIFDNEDEEKEIYTKEQFDDLDKLINVKLCKRGISEQEAIEQSIN